MTLRHARSARHMPVALAALAATLAACSTTSDPASMGAAQAEAAPAGQAALWRRVASDDALRPLMAGTGQVTTAQPLKLAQVPTERGPQILPTNVPTMVVIQEAPERARETGALRSSGRVATEEGEHLAIETAEGLLALTARVGGRPLRFGQGEALEVVMTLGDPFARADTLQLRGERDALGYALVGGDGPVSLDLPVFELSARQEGEGPAPNTMGVVIEVGGETRRVQDFGEPVSFDRSGLDVQVLASIAADEDAAAVLPESHRLELAAWPRK